MKIVITKKCSCEHDLHEITSYPRKGLTIQTFEVGQELEVKEEWSNFYGRYYRCKTDKTFADISINNAKIAK